MPPAAWGMPTGGPAGLQSHTVRNRTSQQPGGQEQLGDQLQQRFELAHGGQVFEGRVPQLQVFDGLANDLAAAEGRDAAWKVAQGGGGGVPIAGSPAWTQAGGLSLEFVLPASGKKLVFTKAGGDPKLALAVRPQESIRWGLNLVWTVIWLAIGLGVMAAVRSASVVSRLSQQLPLAVAVLGVLGFIVLPSPLNGCAFATFVIASLIVAWINRRPTTTT